jgi:hypothetical protein
VKDECVPLAMEEAIRLPLQKVISCDWNASLSEGLQTTLLK